MSLMLGVNVDHVATLRQARGENFPDPVMAARLCARAGADLVVCHLRHDRRHIQDSDVLRLKKESGLPVHLEMACTEEMLRIALKIRPDSVCLVPEAPGEKTTQGGLDLSGRNAARIKAAVTRLKKAGIEVSIFADADPDSLRACKKVGADIVELCTKAYAEAPTRKLQDAELEKLSIAAVMLREMDLRIHAGHGIDYNNVGPIARMSGMECLNIGFSIIAKGVFEGLGSAVSEMKGLM
ncbi:MAG: pyridoxine 5'-phosphate synthase [Elusimicrobia bacterium]|nr:pyridoxine 5'-phosphate synthase [Elusimicrobiota bacterium]